MKNSYMVLIFVLVFMSCSQDKIPALIKVESVEMVKGGFENKTSLFSMIISSDIDLVAYYKKKKAVNFFIFCPLISNNFSDNRHMEPFKLQGFINIEENTLVKKENFYNSFSIYFEDINNKTINDEKIISLLKDKECIYCKLIMPLYVLGPQEQSEKFCIPTKMILENFKN